MIKTNSIDTGSSRGQSSNLDSLAPSANFHQNISKDFSEKELKDGQSSMENMVHDQHDTPEKILSIPGNKMNWKRRARGNNANSSSLDTQIDLTLGKRPIQNQPSHSGSSKKIKVDASPDCSLVLLSSAEAATQPRQTP